MAATEGQDGNAYFIGGKPVGSLADLTLVYNPTTKKWSTLAAPPSGGDIANVAAVTGPQGKIYRLGGGIYDGSGIWDSTSAVDALSTKTGTWSTEASMPTARGDLAAVAGSDGLIYALGGSVFDPNTDLGVSTNVVETYNPVTNSWAASTPMQQPRDTFGAVLGLDGRLYAIGGDYAFSDSSGDYTQTVVASVEAYSFTTRSWSYVAPLPTASLIYGAAVGADGRIYATGPGLLVAYNTKTNTWASLAPPPGTAFFGTYPMTAVGSSHTLLLIETNGKYKSAPAFTYPT